MDRFPWTLLSDADVRLLEAVDVAYRIVGVTIPYHTIPYRSGSLVPLHAMQKTLGA